MEELTHIKQLLFESCCGLEYDGKTVGTGWVADKNIIVSAGHLFTYGETSNIINPQEVNTKPIVACFFKEHPINTKDDNTKYKLKFVCGAYSKFPLIDYCVLKSEQSFEAEPLPIAQNTQLSGAFYTAGVGKKLGTLSHAEGTITGYRAENGGLSSLKLSSEQSGQEGYSGCPIYSVQDKGVIGIQSQMTVNEIGAEKNTILAFQIKYMLDRDLISAPEIYCMSSEESEFDKALSIRCKGDLAFKNGNIGEAHKHYNEAEILLLRLVGKESRYIDDIRKRKNKCTSRKQ